MGVLIVSVALLQFIIGGIIVLLFGFSGLTLFPTFGFLVTLGFEEGPGQALSIGKSWEASGFSHAATMGLSFATIGFLFATFVGVPLTSWMIKKGKSKFYKKNYLRRLKLEYMKEEKEKSWKLDNTFINN